MKRLKLVAGFAAVVACLAALVALSGCTQSQSYTPPEQSPVVNTPTIGTEGTLYVGVDTTNAPLAGTTSTGGKIVGIDVDVASALADELGLKVKFVDVGSDAASALNDGTVDIVMGVNKSTADGSFWVSDEYIPTTVALFTKSSNSSVPTNDQQPKVAAQVSSTSAWAVTNEFENGTLTTTNDLKSAFDALTDGQVDYVASDAVKGLYSASRDELDVHIVAAMQTVSGYGIGVLDSNATLKQAVSDALSSISSDGVINVIETKWLGTPLDLSTVPATEGAKNATAIPSEVSNSDNADSQDGSQEGTGGDGSGEQSGDASTDSSADGSQSTEGSTDASAAASTDGAQTSDTSAQAA